MDPQDLLLTAVRASVVYFFLLLVIRLLGKREVGSTSAFDFMVALMLGEVVDEIIYGDVSMTKGLLVIAVVAVWHLVNAWASYKSKLVDRLTGAEPAVLIDQGVIQEDALAKERMNEDEVLSEMRLMGVDNLKEVNKATLEPSGKISVLLEEWAKPVQKSDIGEVTGEKGSNQKDERPRQQLEDQMKQEKAETKARARANGKSEPAKKEPKS